MLLGIVKWLYDNRAISKTKKDQKGLQAANVTRI
jgi:hypothetical protein